MEWDREDREGGRGRDQKEEDNTHSSNTFCRSYFVESTMSGSSTSGVMIIRDKIATTTVRVSPGRASFAAELPSERSLLFPFPLPPMLFIENISRTLSKSDTRDALRATDCLLKLCSGNRSSLALPRLTVPITVPVVPVVAAVDSTESGGE